MKQGKYIRLQNGQREFAPSGRKTKTFYSRKIDKRGRIVGEGSSAEQEGGAQQNYLPSYGGIPTLPSYYGGPPMQAWGSGAAMLPPNYVVPNVAFAEPYAHFPQPQHSVAIIGGYAARNMQNIAAIQTNAAQLGEGNSNITYELGRLHLSPSRLSISTTGGRLERGGALVIFPFPFFFNFQLVYAYVCVVFSVFTLIFSMCVSFYFHHE
jgi:hypothetical protein